jgi:hypothetical protein
MASPTAPEGSWLDHDAVLRTLDAELAFPPFEAVLAANARVERLVKRAAPRELTIAGRALIGSERA